MDYPWQQAGRDVQEGKWAFAKTEDAESFMKLNGSVLADFETAMRAAYEDMYADTKDDQVQEKGEALPDENGGA